MSFGSPVAGLPSIERITSGETPRVVDAAPMIRATRRNPTAAMDNRTTTRMLPNLRKPHSAEWEQDANPPPSSGSAERWDGSDLSLPHSGLEVLHLGLDFDGGRHCR